MDTQVLASLSQPGEAAEKELGGRGAGEDGRGPSKGKKRMRAGIWSQSWVRAELKAVLTPQDVNAGCAEPRCQGGISPFLKKSSPSPFDWSL